MTKIQKNRIIVGIIIALLVAGVGVGYYNQWWGMPEKSERDFDPIAAGDRIEEAAPFVDVVHVGLSDKSLVAMGNICFHVCVEFYGMETSYAVELTDMGWDVLGEGVYTWEPGQEEDVYTRWHMWTEEKYEYYSTNALFPPGKAELAKEAVEYLHQWEMDKLSVMLLMATFQEAMAVYDQWTFIEITYIGAATTIPELVRGIDETGKPGYVYAYDTRVGAVEVLYKRRYDEPEGEGYWMAEALEKGEFTMEEYRELKELGTIALYPGFHPFYGWMPYVHGFNHPWQAKGVKQ